MKVSLRDAKAQFSIWKVWNILGEFIPFAHPLGAELWEFKTEKRLRIFNKILKANSSDLFRVGFMKAFSFIQTRGTLKL